MAETKSEQKVVDKLETEEDLLIYAKLAEQAERYDDMAKAMAKMIKLKKDGLNTECRNLFSVAYKNVVGARRSSWRVISMIEQKAENERNKKLSKEMREHVEKELNDTCNAVLSTLDTLLAKTDGDDEEKVFYYKMKGDYCRYMAEYVADEKQKNDALEAYDAATEIAKNSTKMNAIHPNRLGLALNFSVFYYEICNEPDKACKLAKEAFDEAIDLMDHNTMKGNDDCKDSTLIMQLLRDNLTLWTSDTGAENGADPQD